MNTPSTARSSDSAEIRLITLWLATPTMVPNTGHAKKYMAAQKIAFSSIENFAGQPNSSIMVAARPNAPASSHGLALPSFVLVRSMIMPMMISEIPSVIFVIIMIRPMVPMDIPMVSV